MTIGDSVTFGRNKDCTHKLNDNYVSGMHCKIWHDKKRNELWIKDYRYVSFATKARNDAIEGQKAPTSHAR